MTHGADINRQAHRLMPRDVTLSLLEALATLPAGERDAWIDFHITGLKHGQQVSAANEKLRAYFGTPDRLREAA